MHRLLKHGIRDGIEVHISRVENGLKCNCTCPCCGMILIAKKGKLVKPQEHFAHESSDQCEFAYETSIHYATKNLLEVEKRIALPYRRKSFDITELSNIFQPKTNDIGIIESKVYELSNIKSEKRLHDVVPDIQATINGNEILIEVAVTSKVKEIKAEKIKRIGVPTIEIDFSNMDRLVTEEDIRLNLFQNGKNKKWIYNPKDDEIINELILTRSILEQKISPFVESFQITGTKSNPAILNCPSPFNRKAKIAVSECRRCAFLIRVNEFDIVCGSKHYMKIKEIIEPNYTV